MQRRCRRPSAKRRWGPKQIFRPLGRIPPEVARAIHRLVFSSTLATLVKKTKNVRHFLDTWSTQQPPPGLLAQHYHLYGYSRKRGMKQNGRWFVVLRGYRRQGCSGDYCGRFLLPFVRIPDDRLPSVGIVAFVMDRFGYRFTEVYSKRR